MNFDCLYYWAPIIKKWLTVEKHGEDLSLAWAKVEVESMGFEVIYGYRSDPPTSLPSNLHLDIHTGGVFFKYAERRK